MAVATERPIAGAFSGAIRGMLGARKRSPLLKSLLDTGPGADRRVGPNRVRIDPERVVAHMRDGDLVVLDLDQQRYIGDDQRLVSVLWPLLASGATKGQMLDCVADAYHCQRREAEPGTVALLDNLDRAGLLTPA